jgi:uroporphyrinogen-III synthase
MSDLKRRTVVVTRDVPGDGALGRALASRGATVRRSPCVTIAPPLDPVPLQREITRVAEYDWVFVTSARAVRALAGRPDARWPKVAAVGSRTADALRRAGLTVDAVGDQDGLALARELARTLSLKGLRILLPASDRARPDTAGALESAGADVTRVIAYRTLTRAEALPRLRAAAMDPIVDALTFVSPSAAEALGPAEELPGAAVALAAIGRSTAATLRDAGWPDVIMPPRPTFAGLALALGEALAREESP